MKVEKVIPCVCVPHPPTAGDRTLYGMPIIHTNGSYFSCECPVCGRGGKFLQHNSAFMALRYWNEIQEHCYASENKEIIYEDDFRKYFDEMTGHKKKQFKSDWDEI